MKRALRRFGAALVAAAGLAGALSSTAHADDVRTVGLRGGGCPAGAGIVVSIDGTRSDTAAADARGNYDLSILLPYTGRSTTVGVTCGSHTYEIAVPTQIAERESRLSLAALVVGVGAMLTTMIVVVRRRNVIDLRDPPLATERPAPEPAQQTGTAEVAR